MRITIQTPTKALVEASTEALAALAKFLSYVNSNQQFVYRKHMKNRWWRERDRDGWQVRADELKNSMSVCLVFKENGQYFVRPGSVPYIKERFPDTEIFEAPELRKNRAKPKPFPWYKKLPFELYPYQKESVDKLISIGHGNVQLCTGAGKSAILLTIARNLGLKTVVATPSVSIFTEMLSRFEKHLGKSNVGALGDGKKRLGKLFTIAISKSLSNLKSGSKEFEELADADVLLVDESHLWGASTLEDVCHNLFAKVPYRMFFSGTQTRGDGGEKLLQSIIGKTVMELTTADAIRGGYICDHEFRIVSVRSSDPGFQSDDPLAMKRQHFLYNDNIAQFIGKLANSVWEVKKEQTLVLVDEIDQIYRLIPHIKVPYICATGENRKDLGDSDPIEAVEKFNRGEAKVLIGTSCISTGTNIFPTHHTVNWQGGSSEIKTKQGAVGRSVRKLEGSGYEKFHTDKKKAVIWDFDILKVPEMERQLQTRISYYKDSGVEIKAIK